MKRAILVIIGAIILGLILGYGGYRYFANQPENEPSTNGTSSLPSTDKFMWGVNMRPSSLGNYQLEIWNQQIGYAKALGVKWARIGWDYENADPFKRNDEVVNALINNGMGVVMIIEPTGSWTNMDTYQNGYENGKKIAAHYKGKIKYYQMINEGGAMCIKHPTDSGVKTSNYDAAKYKKVKEYLLGASKGISEGDPDAIRIVSISYTHVGYLDKLVQDKVDFDWIGLDWYDWMGDIGTKKIDGGKLLSTKLKSYNKPLVFMEVNAVPNQDSKGSSRRTKVDQNKQASFITSTAKWAYKNKDWVKGFFIHELVDNVNNPNDNLEYYGIVSAKKSASGVNVPGDVRKAFTEMQTLIKNSP